MKRAIGVGILLALAATLVLLIVADRPAPAPVPPEPGRADPEERNAAPDVAPPEGTHTLRGRVLRPDDTPAPDANVHAGPFSDAKIEPRAGVAADENGRFEIPDLAPGIYLLSALSESGGAGYRPFVTVPSEEPVTIRLTGKSAWISGRVVDEEDRPVPGGTVLAVSETPLGTLYESLGFREFPGAKVRVEGMADGAGRFRLGPLPPGPCRLSRLMEGHSYGWGLASAPTQNAVIRVITMGAVRGTVAVAGDEMPKEVGVGLAPSGRYVSVTPGPEPVPFELPWIRPGTYRVGATARGFRRSESDRIKVVAGETAGPVALVLRPATLLTGVVRDRDGVPVRGAKIVLVHRRTVGRETSLRRWHWDPVVADDSGSYRIRLEPGTWQVRAEKTGYFPPDGEVRIEVGEETVQHDLRLEPTNAITGTVQDAAGDPVAGLRVHLEGFFKVRDESGRATGGGTTRHEPAVTDEDGRFALHDVAEEQPFGIVVRGDLESPVRLESLAFPEGKSRLDLEITVVPLPPKQEPDRPPEEPHAEFTGRVVDEEGQPVPDAILLAIGSFARSGPDGRFVLRDSAVGHQQITYSALGRTVAITEDFDAVSGTRDIGRLVLPREGLVITGRVTDRAGAGIEGVMIECRFEKVRTGEGRFLFRRDVRAVTMTDGVYRVAGPALREAEVHLHLRREGYHDAGRQERVNTGATFDFTMKAESGIRGMIAFSGPTPDNIAITGLCRVDGVMNHWEFRPRWDPEEREYRIDDAPAGRRRLVISANGYATAVTEEIEIVEGRITVVPEVAMTPGGTLAGTVLEAAGKPVPGATLTVWIPDRTISGTADERGRFRIGNVPPGRWKLQANHPEVHRVSTVPVTLEDGAVTTVDVRLPAK